MMRINGPPSKRELPILQKVRLPKMQQVVAFTVVVANNYCKYKQFEKKGPYRKNSSIYAVK